MQRIELVSFETANRWQRRDAKLPVLKVKRIAALPKNSSMFKAIQTSVSGLVASSARLNVAASNIVNSQVKSTPLKKGTVPSGLIFSAGYTPKRVEQSTTKTGGVRVTIAPVSPASLSVFDPTSPLANAQGSVNIPNVSLPTEIGEMRRASHAYKANARVIQTLDETFKTLLET